MSKLGAYGNSNHKKTFSKESYGQNSGKSKGNKQQNDNNHNKNDNRGDKGKIPAKTDNGSKSNRFCEECKTNSHWTNRCWILRAKLKKESTKQLV